MKRCFAIFAAPREIPWRFGVRDVFSILLNRRNQKL